MAGLLELEDLTRRFGAVTALDGLSFHVPAGEVVGFLGPNGAGKTTTMRAIFGLTDLDAGSVRWNGAPVGQAERRRFGYMPEERGLYPSKRVGVVADSAPLNAVLRHLATSVGVRVQFVPEPGLSQARAALTSGRLDMVVDGTNEILVGNPTSASDTSSGARYVRDVSQLLGEQRAYARAGLTPKQSTIVAGAQPLPVDSVRPAKTERTASETTALLGVILIFVVLSQYLTGRSWA